MQRIRTVLQKLTELAQRNPDRTVIDVDLMLDYTRVIYADLLEMRGGMTYKPQLNINEPTLDELTKSMEAEQEPVQESVVTFPQPVFAAPLPAKETYVAVPVQQPQPVPQAVAEEPAKPLSPLPPLPPTPTPGKDIRRFIDLNDKYLFLSDLFNNDMRAYEETMNELNTCTDKQQALQLLGVRLSDEGNNAHTGFRQLLDRFFEQ